MGYHYAATGVVFLPGDFDRDGDVDLDDYEQFAGFMTGPEPPPGGLLDPCATIGDFDGDGDLDLRDFAQLQIALGQ